MRPNAPDDQSGKTANVNSTDPLLQVFATRGRVLRCTIVFITLVGLFYAFVHSPSVETSFWHSYLVLHARITDLILTVVGWDTHVSDTTVVGTRFAMEIVRGCDAIEPIAIYTAAGNPAFAAEVRSALQMVIDDGTWLSLFEGSFGGPPPWTMEEMLAVPPADR